MTPVRHELCIVTPDNFYGVLLREAAFPSFNCKVLKGLDDLALLDRSYMPDAVLVFATHLGPYLLAKTVLEVRSLFPRAALFQIVGVRDPRLELIWSSVQPNSKNQPSLPAHDVQVIDEGIAQFIASPEDSEFASNSLTRSQLSIVQALALGKSNSEIAVARNTSVRAVETLVSRSMARIGATGSGTTRSKIIASQNYLRKIGLDYSYTDNPD